MSASLYDITIGQQTELTRVLADAGLTPSTVKRIIRNPDLARQMIGAVQQPVFSNADLFISPEDVFSRFHQRAEQREWPIPVEYCDRLAVNMPAFPTDPLKAVCLKIWLGSAEQTAEELWAWVADSYPGSGCYRALRFDSEHFQLFDPSRYGSDPSVEWELIDFGSYWDPENGRSVLGVWDQATAKREVLADLDILTTAAVYPHFVRAMDGENIPYLNMAGVRVVVSGEEPWVVCPDLTSGRSGQVKLGVNWAGGQLQGWAAPTVIEL